MIKSFKKIIRSRLADIGIWVVLLVVTLGSLLPKLIEIFLVGNFSILKEFNFYFSLTLFFFAVYNFLMTYIHKYGWKYKADVAYENGDLKIAIKYYTTLIKIFRWNGRYLVNRGNCYYKMSNWQLAIRDYTKALKLEPDAAYIYENRAYAYKMIGFRKQSAYDTAKAKKLGNIN